MPSTLNDTLVSSFYLYDHLGNTRVVYTPEVQCPTYVTYAIDYVADYYPYGCYYCHSYGCLGFPKWPCVSSLPVTIIPGISTN